jgi:transposase
VLFGVHHVETGYRLFLERRRPRGEDIRAFLYVVRRHHPGLPIPMALDKVSSHKGGASRALAEELGIELLWLPKRSPRRNPADHLWRHGTEDKCANHQYRSIEEQVRAFMEYLYGLGPTEALLRAGAFSDDSWNW